MLNIVYGKNCFPHLFKAKKNNLDPYEKQENKFV